MLAILPDTLRTARPLILASAAIWVLSAGLPSPAGANPSPAAADGPMRTAGGISEAEARRLMMQAEQVQAADLEQAKRDLEEARRLFERGSFDAADALLKQVSRRLPAAAAARGIEEEVSALRNEILQDRADEGVEANRLARDQRGAIDRNWENTREAMLNEVGEFWARPRVYEAQGREETVVDSGSPILEKLNGIVIPRVTFNGELSRVIETLSELSVRYDTFETEPIRKGVNIVLIDPNGQDPEVNISLRHLSLARILEFVTKQVNYQYDVAQDAVIVSRGDSSGGNASLVTEFFPVSRATVIRLTGFRGEEQVVAAAAVDPFSVRPAASTQGPTVSDEEDALKSFFERAGVPFDSVPGATLAFDGTQLIVTQTTRNLERLRNILRRYDQTKQVEIEAKFLEVNQGDLEELGFEWRFNGSATPLLDPDTGEPVLGPDGLPMMQYRSRGRTDNRSLNAAFSVDPADSSISITNAAGDSQLFDASPPTPPAGTDLAGDVILPLLSHSFIIDSDAVDLAIRALSRKTGSDLLSSPRLTVLSGKTANIVVAQELLYPESYGDVQLPSPGGSREGSVSTIAIGAGTPQDFVKRNIGVEMQVTPTVEDNDNISLLLEPKVTEFEGFVEYGGPSIAVGGDGTVVTVPSGFFQPIFSTRSVRTEVTIYDGATVVIGGLVREEVKSVDDKVPILGDIPLVGNLFKSKGETSQKRNLMIFVTANLISPGGSPSRQRLQAVEPNTLFQNPVIVTPGGSEKRTEGE